ncbi:hypothetical protein OROMI_015207 [Orobanche minor]
MKSDCDEDIEDSVRTDNEECDENSEESYDSDSIGKEKLLVLSETFFLYSVDCETEEFENGHATSQLLKFEYPNSWTEVWDVVGGYVLASNVDNKLCLLNPKTLECVILPDSPSFGKDIVCCDSLVGFSHSFIDSDDEDYKVYKVLQISFLYNPDANNHYTLVDFFSTATGSWRRTKLDNIYNNQPQCRCSCHFGSVMNVLNNREYGFTFKDKNMPQLGTPRVGKRSEIVKPKSQGTNVVCPRCNWSKCGHLKFVNRNGSFFLWSCSSKSENRVMIACVSFETESYEEIPLPLDMDEVFYYRLLNSEEGLCIATLDYGARGETFWCFDLIEETWKKIVAPMLDSEMDAVLNGIEVDNIPASFTAKCLYNETSLSIQEEIDAVRAYIETRGM